MGLLAGLKKLLETIADQVFTSTGAQPARTPDPREVRFTPNFLAVAKARGLSEKDGRDVYHHGSVVKPNMICRKYNGYQLCIYYFVSDRTGQPFISSIWKQVRR